MVSGKRRVGGRPSEQRQDRQSQKQSLHFTFLPFEGTVNEALGLGPATPLGFCELLSRIGRPHHVRPGPAGGR
jgi:hypothetical protein